MGKNIHLSYKELKEIAKHWTKRRKRRNNANKSKQNNAKFGESKYESNMRDYVTSSAIPTKPPAPTSSVFPSGSGPSSLSREIDTLRGELNKQTNKLIRDNQGAPRLSGEKKESSLPSFKSNEHKRIYDIGSEMIEGKRAYYMHPDGSLMISKKIDEYNDTFEDKTKNAKSGSRVEILSSETQSNASNDSNYFSSNDGVGDVEKPRFEFSEKNLKNPNRLGLTPSISPIPNNPPPKRLYMPTGDNIDVAEKSFIFGDPVQEQQEEEDMNDINQSLWKDSEEENVNEPEEVESKKSEGSEGGNLIINISGLDVDLNGLTYNELLDLAKNNNIKLESKLPSNIKSNIYKHFTKKPKNNDVLLEDVDSDSEIEVTKKIINIDGKDIDLSGLTSRKLKELAKENNISLKNMTRSNQFVNVIYDHFTKKPSVYYNNSSTDESDDENNSTAVESINYNNYTVPELKKTANMYGLKFGKKITKSKLIELIQSYEQFRENLSSMQHKQLQKKAKEKGIKANLSKDELIKELLQKF